MFVVLIIIILKLFGVIKTSWFVTLVSAVLAYVVVEVLMGD
jgi:hypothetical protein